VKWFEYTGTIAKANLWQRTVALASKVTTVVISIVAMNVNYYNFAHEQPTCKAQYNQKPWE
jgi:hypothetical protein